jgi:hypothetical protein
MEKFIVDKEQGLASASDEARRDVFLRKLAELVRKKNGTNETEKKGETK